MAKIEPPRRSVQQNVVRTMLNDNNTQNDEDKIYHQTTYHVTREHQKAIHRKSEEFSGKGAKSAVVRAALEMYLKDELADIRKEKQK